MKKKIIGIFIVTLFLVTTTLPLVIGNQENVHKNTLNFYDLLDNENILINEECTSVIVTGSCCKDGRAILLKNRDCFDNMNRPYYYTPGDGYYNYTAINQFWMGMNERGLAVMNTAITGVGYDNGYFNEKILKSYETVEEVWSALNDKYSPIGRVNRGEVASCVGVIDRYGSGAYFEVSEISECVFWVNDSFRGAANDWRQSGGDGGPRCVRVEKLLTDIYNSKGEISWQDVIQIISRDVYNKEQGDGCFSIYRNVCNELTNAAFVAVSGDYRYNGKLNCFWAEYYNPPIIGLFAPLMVSYGNAPREMKLMGGYVKVKKDYAQEPCEGGSYYNSERVREIQKYTFHAENYTFNKYDEFMRNIPDDLSDQELSLWVEDFIEDSFYKSLDVYLNEEANFRPEIPETPYGVVSGKINDAYTYETTTTDYENDQIYYFFDWGDNTTSNWVGPFDSDEIGNASHTWSVQGNYSIMVKAKDEHGAESEWSDPLPITMPRNKPYNNTPFLNFLENHTRLSSLFKNLFELEVGGII